VISGTVVQRTNEIGIRMALGAQIRDILSLILGQGVRLTLLGVALGLSGVFGVAHLLHAIAPRVPGADLATTAIVTAVLLAIAIFASWLPARRAAKLDPVVALRDD
jgi:ABC-type antimicrobial peptide transport system permease subunit